MKKRIIKQLRDGSAAAFEEVYNKYYRLIKQICYFYVKDNATAEDLSIESFTKLWNNRHRLDPSRNFKYYLTQIAHNTSRDYLRKKNRENVLILENEDLEYVAPEEEVRDYDEDLFEKVAEILDDESYQMLVYRYVHNLKHCEIAEILGVTTSVVTNKVARALQKLRENLKDEKR